MSLWLLKQRFKWKLLFDRLAREADMFHVILNEKLRRSNCAFLPQDRLATHVIPNAGFGECLPHRQTEDGKRVLVELGIANRPTCWLPGDLHHRKNAELILKAWPANHETEMHDVALVIINHSDPVVFGSGKGSGTFLKC